ncbi:MAG: hypothetical protein HY342_05210, partial [Candidatus Lambdaproteobacteria bacterium]|nr:hypothetical protein [Candidatus Lambdaproteobacteria bacterium]
HIGPDEIVRGRLLAALQPRLPIRIPPGDAVNFATLDDALAYLELRLNGIAQ